MAEIGIMDRRKWLLRLIYVRLVVFTIFGLAETIRSSESAFYVLVLLAAVYALSAFWFVLLRLNESYVWQSYGQIGVELQRSTGQVAFLQAFSDRVIDSLGTGLVTTDSQGRIYLFNRAAEEITGQESDRALRLKIWEVFPGLLPKVRTSRFEISTVR